MGLQPITPDICTQLDAWQAYLGATFLALLAIAGLLTLCLLIMFLAGLTLAAWRDIRDFWRKEL